MVAVEVVVENHTVVVVVNVMIVVVLHTVAKTSAVEHVVQAAAKVKVAVAVNNVNQNKHNPKSWRIFRQLF